MDDHCRAGCAWAVHCPSACVHSVYFWQLLPCKQYGCCALPGRLLLCHSIHAGAMSGQLLLPIWGHYPNSLSNYYCIPSRLSFSLTVCLLKCAADSHQWQVLLPYREVPHWWQLCNLSSWHGLWRFIRPSNLLAGFLLPNWSHCRAALPGRLLLHHSIYPGDVPRQHVLPSQLHCAHCVCNWERVPRWLDPALSMQRAG